MAFHRASLRETVKLILQKVGLLPAARRFRRFIKPELTREQAHYQRFVRFKRQYGRLLGPLSNHVSHDQKKVLVISIGFPQVEIELGLLKGLELAGYVPVVLITEDYDHELLQAYYHLAAIEEVLIWSEFSDPLDLDAAEAVIKQYGSVEKLLEFECAGARVGKFAVSTALRRHRLGSIDLESSEERQILLKYLASAVASVAAAQRIAQQVRPELVLYVDRVYTPAGELIDVCLANGMTAIRWDKGHKNNALVLKRYTQENRDEHAESLSEETWQLIRDMEWTEAQREQLHQELLSSYVKGDWYSQAATQYNKRLLDGDTIRQHLGLDPAKKTAIIFPHILWDSSFFFGEDLFRDYEEWLVETVLAACKNDQVNWVIKIHPAHVGKNVADGFQGDPAEVIVLRKHLSHLPPHVFTIPAESEINTFSLFELMDYCLTVRGTIGMEAARLGIPVLTAGTGRYDRRGFTIDSDSREEYLEKVAAIQDIPRLSPAQRELAERFAYGIFVLRPFPVRTVTLEYHDQSGVNKTEINLKSKEDWYSAPDLRAFIQWLTGSNQADFLMPLSGVYPSETIVPKHGNGQSIHSTNADTQVGTASSKLLLR